MCKKLYYCGTRIDPCLVEQINEINQHGYFKTLLCCCGHNKYPKTIIVMEKHTKNVYEFFTGFFFGNGVRRGKRYYKRDKERYYFIPELKKG